MDQKSHVKTYLDKLDHNQRGYFPLPYLMAKRNTYDALRPESAKVRNDHYRTDDFLTFSFFKNIATPLPSEIMDSIKP